MAIFKDITGQVFGKLTVIEFSRNVKSGTRDRKYWLCKCECGNTKEIRTDSLTSGNVSSCGCLRDKQAVINVQKNHRHKLSYTRVYGIWQNMKDRCQNPENKSYVRYGGRGIKVCDEWLVPDNFFEWALNNGYRDDLTIDRIDNDGNYEPTNCRWTTNKEQSRNRRSNIMIEYKGQALPLIEISELTGLSLPALYTRYSKGIRGEKLFAPVAERGESREVEYYGKIISLRELSEITGINYYTLGSRWRAGKRGAELYK